MLFDARHHRNKWAHQSILSPREAYRALDVIEQLLSFFKDRVLLEAELSSVSAALDEVILQLVRHHCKCDDVPVYTLAHAG